MEETNLTPETQTSQPGRRQGSSFQRAAAAALLAVGLLTVGGVAIVNAASPDPSASTAPSATDNGTGGSSSPSTNEGGSGNGQSANCPNM
jgi:hypothetical protein